MDKKAILKSETSSLQLQIQQLDEEIRKCQERGLDVAELDEHIKLLHEYNDAKDAAQAIFGKLGCIQGVSVKEIHEKFGLTADD